MKTCRFLFNFMSPFSRKKVYGREFKDKDSEATEWLNQMAVQGYRLVAIATSPIYLSQPLSTTNIANSITLVVENTQTLSA
jgi:hypothetical protein